MSSSTWSRLGLVAMSLLWSLSVNCLVVVLLPDMVRWQQVGTITIIDNLGKSALNASFIVAHLKCWDNLLARCLLTGMVQHRSNRHRHSPAPQQRCCDIFFFCHARCLPWVLLDMAPTRYGPGSAHPLECFVPPNLVT